MMCKILKVFYVLFTLIVFLSEAVLSLSCFILINSALTMQLAFKNVIQCQKLVRKNYLIWKNIRGEVREVHLKNLVRTLIEMERTCLESKHLSKFIV